MRQILIQAEGGYIVWVLGMPPGVVDVAKARNTAFSRLGRPSKAFTDLLNYSNEDLTYNFLMNNRSLTLSYMLQGLPGPLGTSLDFFFAAFDGDRKSVV